MKKKIQNFFRNNEMETVPDEDLNEHLQYFKENVLDDRLEFNQTKIVEEIGNYFLALYELMHCDDNIRITLAVREWYRINSGISNTEIERPEKMTKVELFHWEVKWLSCWRFEKTRLTDFIPQTADYLIE